MNSQVQVRVSRSILVLFFLTCSAPLAAVDRVLAGEFDGSEATTANLPGNCSRPAQLGYRVVSPVQVSSSGSYSVTDAFNFHGVDVTALIYQGPFNPASPQTNLVTPAGIDLSADVNLQSGVDYTLVVQQWCEVREGAWAVTFSGPGSVTSANVANVPAFTMGSLTGNEPLLNGDCGNAPYKQTGPLRVARSGVYYYTDISITHALDMCVQIYTAPVNTANPAANRIASLDDFGQASLQANTDYWFVIQPFDQVAGGDYFFVFAPPAEFRMNAGMAGSWFNPATAGQGFFLDVFEKINQVFLAWFSYDLSRPAGNVPAEIGDPGHRWLTAFGPFSGAAADLSIEWTTGGVFDAASPVPTQSVDGTINIDFDDCTSGRVTYDLGSANASGVVPIQRIANDNVGLCEALVDGPGQPGPL